MNEHKDTVHSAAQDGGSDISMSMTHVKLVVCSVRWTVAVTGAIAELWQGTTFHLRWMHGV